MRTSAVVVNYDGGEDVLGCLRSLGASTVPLEVVVVDNASADGSDVAIERAFPHVRLLRNARNAGFGAAVNAGVRESSCPYVVLVNPDARAEATAVGRLVEFLDDHPAAAAAAATILNPDGSVQPSKRVFPTLWQSVQHGLLGLFRPDNPGTRAYLQLDRCFDEPARVDWVAMNAVAIRRDAFDAIGGFDEDFFFFVEDVDLCRRLQDAGWQIWFVPDAVFTHEWGGAWTRRPLKFLWMHNANLFRYVRKHRRGAWVLLYPLVAAGLLLRFGLQAVRYLVSRQAVPAHSRRLRSAEREGSGAEEASP